MLSTMMKAYLTKPVLKGKPGLYSDHSSLGSVLAVPSLLSRTRAPRIMSSTPADIPDTPADVPTNPVQFVKIGKYEGYAVRRGGKIYPVCGCGHHLSTKPLDWSDTEPVSTTMSDAETASVPPDQIQEKEGEDKDSSDSEQPQTFPTM